MSKDITVIFENHQGENDMKKFILCTAMVMALGFAFSACEMSLEDVVPEDLGETVNLILTNIPSEPVDPDIISQIGPGVSAFLTQGAEPTGSITDIFGEADPTPTPTPYVPKDGFDLTHFSAVDLDGNEVNEEIFKNYDITMVNIWATWCGYCVEEMPGIADLYKDLPTNVNIITLCDDAAEAKNTAAAILKKAGAEFTTLVGNAQLATQVVDYVSGFPTTIFVDSNGEVVGKEQIGAPRGDVKTAYQNLINSALKQIGKQ